MPYCKFVATLNLDIGEQTQSLHTKTSDEIFIEVTEEQDLEESCVGEPTKVTGHLRDSFHWNLFIRQGLGRCLVALK